MQPKNKSVRQIEARYEIGLLVFNYPLKYNINTVGGYDIQPTSNNEPNKEMTQGLTDLTQQTQVQLYVTPHASKYPRTETAEGAMVVSVIVINADVYKHDLSHLLVSG